MEDIIKYLNKDLPLKNAILFAAKMDNIFEKGDHISYLKNLLVQYLNKECKIYEIKKDEVVNIRITFKGCFNNSDAVVSIVLSAIKIWEYHSSNDETLIEVNSDSDLNTIYISSSNILPDSSSDLEN